MAKLFLPLPGNRTAGDTRAVRALEIKMSEQNPTDQPDAPSEGVPPQLIQQLHEANEQFSRARQHVDQAIDAEINCLEERDRASHEVRDAERVLEKLDEKIGKELL